MTVLTVMAALSVILLTALTFALSRYAAHQRALNRQGAAWLAETGVSRALTHLTSVSRGDMLPADTFDTPNGGSVLYVTHPWGVLALVAAEGRQGSQVFHRNALVGSWQADAVAPAVTVGDETLPLTITGRTTVTGNVVSGPVGVVEGRLNGIGAVYPNFLRGANIVRPEVCLPAIDTAMLRCFLTALAQDRQRRDIVWSGSRVMGEEDRLPAELGVIYVENNLILDGVADWPHSQVRTIVVGGSVDFTGETYLRAPVSIVAGAHIRVGGNAVLDGTLLYAEDSVVFTDSCSFSGAAVSPRLVATRQAAALRFPAVLVTYHDRGERDTSVVALCSLRPAEATACAFHVDTSASLRQAIVSVDTAAILYGCVLTNGVTDLRGTVFGSVLTEQFIYELPPTTYVNWLRDCRIDRSRLKIGRAHV